MSQSFSLHLFPVVRRNFSPSSLNPFLALFNVHTAKFNYCERTLAKTPLERVIISSREMPRMRRIRKVRRPRDSSRDILILLACFPLLIPASFLIPAINRVPLFDGLEGDSLGFLLRLMTRQFRNIQYYNTYVQFEWKFKCGVILKNS